MLASGLRSQSAACLSAADLRCGPERGVCQHLTGEYSESPPRQIQPEKTVTFNLQNVPPAFFLAIATTLEVCGDAVVRIALYSHPGLTPARIGVFLIGAVLLFGYGSFLNLAPLEFRHVVGLYIAILFVVWQIINFVFFRTLPTTPIVLGGILIVAGGMIVSFWRQ